MSLGKKLFQLRKKEGLSQEEVAEKLNVSRQTVSKWETDQTAPELHKAKLLSQFYNISYDYLFSEGEASNDAIFSESMVDEIDWTRAWSKKYPILESYPNTAGVDKYCNKISELYTEFKDEFNFSVIDTFLILKDILYQEYKKDIVKTK